MDTPRARGLRRRVMRGRIATCPGMLEHALLDPATLPALDDGSLPRWLAQPGVGVLDFTARWCGPCKLLTPVLVELAARYRGRVRIATVDVEAAPAAVTALRVVSMPTLVLVRDGAPVGRVVGVRPARFLAGTFDRALAGDVAIASP